MTMGITFLLESNKRIVSLPPHAPLCMVTVDLTYSDSSGHG